MMGKSYELFFGAEDRGNNVTALLLAESVRLGSSEFVGWRMRTDGTAFRARAHLFALRSATGSLRDFAKITRDLTETLQAGDLERRLAIERAGREAAETAELRVRASAKLRTWPGSLLVVRTRLRPPILARDGCSLARDRERTMEE